MKAVKANKEYTIDDSLKERYRQDGFDIYDDYGELVAYAAGKTVKYEAYAQAIAEKDAALAELAAMKKPARKK